MPVAEIRGIRINYETSGEKGPWMALSPGGRRELQALRPLAEKMVRGGYRVVLHDRRNCGASDVVIEGEESEYEIWADDLHELLSRLDGLPAIVGGASSGCRLAIVFALRHPAAVRALLLWRVTGGLQACEKLAAYYYGDYIDAAKAGGMAAVCETEHFAERIRDNPANGEALMAMDPERFIAVMSHWSDYFLEGADLPVIGATEADLRSIRVPACVVPGNDHRHPRETGRNAQRLIPEGELHELMKEDLDVDLGPVEDWQAIEDEMAMTFTGFLERAGAPGEK